MFAAVGAGEAVAFKGANMASVIISEIHKKFGGVHILKGVSVDIEDGEFVILVGPSGCGKSTLLRMIAGLETITAGKLSIDGRVVNDDSPKDRDIAMVFQSYALYPHMTIAENMGFPLMIREAGKDEIAAAVNNAAEVLGLTHLLDRYPRQLSGGQRQRVAMGRAIVRDPKVFLFDEPLSNLDAKLRVQMRSEIKGLQQRLATTTIYVTHDQIEAMTMADKIVVMRDGFIEQIGAPLDVYDRPANQFVAGFIGSPSMNFLPGRLEGDVFRTESGLVLPRGSSWGAVEPQDAVYGMRPEHMQLSEDGAEVEVVVVEPTGAETEAVVRHGSMQFNCLFRERLTIGSGDKIRIKPDPVTVHLFSKSDGRRLS